MLGWCDCCTRFYIFLFSLDVYLQELNSFSLQFPDIRMASSKISPAAFLSASLLHFTTRQYFPSSFSFILSKHIFVTMMLRLVFGPLVQRQYNEAVQSHTLIHDLYSSQSRTLFEHCGMMGIRKCVWWSLVAVSTCKKCTQCVRKWSKELLLCNCMTNTALICSRTQETRTRSSLSPNKDTDRWPHGPENWTGSQAAEPSLPERFSLLQPRNLFSVDLLSTEITHLNISQLTSNPI